MFDLPRARWNLGTMFFVAESITVDPAELRAAVAAFTGALTPRCPVRGGLHGGLERIPGG